MLNIEQNIQDIKIKINNAVKKTNRSSEDVEIIAVTKTVGVEEVEKVIEAGITNIGENRVQELLKKYETIGNRVKWHLIGHLQRNKVKYIVDKVDMIHSLDSYELALEIEKRAKAINRVIDCLLQVNVSGEKTKYGVKPEVVKELLLEISKLKYVNITGLMTMAPYVEDSEEVRKYFRDLKELAQTIAAEDIDNVEMKYLSMGMSNDYEVAVEEGANLIRIGSAIFHK